MAREKKSNGKKRNHMGRMTVTSSLGGHGSAPPAPAERSAKLDAIEDRLRAAEAMDDRRMVGGGGSRFKGQKNSRPQ